MLLSTPLALPAPGSVTPYTSSYDLARELCFDQTVALGLLSAADLSQHPFSQRRGHFAGLWQGFIAHLRPQRLDYLCRFAVRVEYV